MKHLGTFTFNSNEIIDMFLKVISLKNINTNKNYYIYKDDTLSKYLFIKIQNSNLKTSIILDFYKTSSHKNNKMTNIII